MELLCTQYLRILTTQELHDIGTLAIIPSLLRKAAGPGDVT